MEYILIFAYMFLGYQANMYLRRVVLNQVAVLYTDTMRFYLMQLFWGFALGWITIPLAVVTGLFKMATQKSEEK